MGRPRPTTPPTTNRTHVRLTRWANFRDSLLALVQALPHTSQREQYPWIARCLPLLLNPWRVENNRRTGVSVAQLRPLWG